METFENQPEQNFTLMPFEYLRLARVSRDKLVLSHDHEAQAQI